MLSFYQEPVKYNYHFCYINCNRNYLINCVENLFKDKTVTMFANQEKYIIHSAQQPCESQKSPDSNVKAECYTFINDTYPKNKLLPVVVKILTNHSLLDENLFFIPFPRIHLADFCSYINNKFDKNSKPDPLMFKLCKYLQNQKIKLPKIAVKNPAAHKYLI